MELCYLSLGAPFYTTSSNVRQRSVQLLFCGMHEYSVCVCWGEGAMNTDHDVIIYLSVNSQIVPE